MVIRWGRFGKFIACSGYPECKNSRPLESAAEAEIAVDEHCPICSGDMIVKSGRFGKFLACGRYPECDFSTWSRPTGELCPECGGLIVSEASGKTKCLACDHRGAA